MATAGRASVDIVGDFSSIQKQAAAVFNGSAWGKKGKIAGAGLAAGIAAAGVGKVLFDIGRDFDDAYDKIRVGTGATGKSLEKLKGSFKNVLKDVPTDFDTAATAIADLNTRLGLTGKPLERLSKQFTELSRITETDVKENIASVSRAFGDWEIKTKDQTDQLDKFFRASQSSGASVSELARQVVQFGAPLRQVGFSLDEATAMFASFEQAGVNTQTMMPGLKFALKKFLTEDIDPKKGLIQTFKGIEDGTIKASDALDIFGQRAGADMVEAINQGRFDLDKMTESLVSGSDTIRKAGRDTMDFSEQWQLFKNRVLVGLEPLATRVFGAVGKGMEFIARFSLSKITADIRRFFSTNEDAKAFADAIQVVGEVIKFTFNEIVLPVAKRFAAAIGQVFQGLITTVKGAVKIIAGILTLDFKKAWDGVKDIFKGSANIVLGILRGLTAPVREATARIGQAMAVTFRAGWGVVKDIFRGSTDAVLRITTALTAPIRAVVSRIGSVMTSVFREAWGAIKDVFRAGKDALHGIMNGLGKGITSAARGIKEVFRSVGRVIKNVVQWIINTINKALDAFGALKDKIDSVVPDVSLPDITPWSGLSPFQSGGLINGGAPSGDSVPALLERGEGVLNRNAVEGLGGPAFVNWANDKWSRFQKGGVIEALGPHAVPPFKYDAAHAGGNSHWHIGFSSSAQAVAMGKRFQQMGFMVSQHPAFGGFFTRPYPSLHHSGQAIDVNSAADETLAETQRVAAILGGVANAIMQIPAIKVKGTGPMAGLVRGVGDKLRKAGNAFLKRKMPSEGLEPGVNVRAGKKLALQAWATAGGSPGLANLMAAIAMAESSGNPGAVGHDPGGTQGLGLWQITTGFNDDLIAKYGGRSAMFNPVLNAKAARDILARQGLGAWVVYNTGAHRQYLQRGGMIPSFGDGGVVPGPKGAPRLVVAHGGETIRPDGDGPVSVTLVIEDGAGVDPNRIRAIVNGDRAATVRFATRGATAGGRSR